MTNSEFADWKRHPVTQQIYAQLQERIDYYIECLVDNAGKNPIQDVEYSTAIRAYRDIFSIQHEETHGS